MARRSLTGFLSRAPFLDTQLVEGVGTAYTANIGASTVSVYRNNAQTQLLQLLFTPNVDAWWEVEFHIGILLKADAAYGYAYGQINLSPAPPSGSAQGQQISTQHSGVDNYMGVNVAKIFRLTAGVAYTAQPQLSINSGTWQYSTDSNTLWMQGKAWPR